MRPCRSNRSLHHQPDISTSPRGAGGISNKTSRGTSEPDSHPSRGCVLPRKYFVVETTEVSELFTTWNWAARIVLSARPGHDGCVGKTSRGTDEIGSSLRGRFGQCEVSKIFTTWNQKPQKCGRKYFQGNCEAGAPFVGRSNRSSSPPGTRSRAMRGKPNCKTNSVAALELGAAIANP